MPKPTAIAPRPKEPRPEPETTTVLRDFEGYYIIRIKVPAIDEEAARAKFLEIIREDLEDGRAVFVYEC